MKKKFWWKDEIRLPVLALFYGGLVAVVLYIVWVCAWMFAAIAGMY